MLTVSEVSDRKKARKQLELKRIALEEAVERAVCERIYDKLWKHRTTDDDARDEKLRSRTAALSLVGIGLKELHVDIEPSDGPTPKTAAEKEAEIHSSLAPAREALERMDDERYPLGKLQHLTVAHKSIVETLSQLFPSSSSADEILPTLIYTLITSSDLDLNVVSNLNFIQRFRASSKVDGESAYCLVNLEASISFLETVDLSSLRADEPPEGPAKSSSRPSTPNTDKTAPAQPAVNRSLKPETTAVSALSHDKSTPDTTNKPLPSTTTSSRPGAPHRRLSSMVQAQADRFEASRENLLQAADKVYDSINGTLENSLASSSAASKTKSPTTTPPCPKPSRKPASSSRPLPAATPEDEYPPSITLSGRSSPADDPLTSEPPSANQKPTTTSRPLELLAGRRPTRDRSATAPAARPAVANAPPSPPPAALRNPPTTNPPAPGPQQTNPSTPPQTSSQPSTRSTASRPPCPRSRASAAQPAPALRRPRPSLPPRRSPLLLRRKKRTPTPRTSWRRRAAAWSEGGSDLNAIEALAELRRIKPPRRRFLEVQGAGGAEVTALDEVLELAGAEATVGLESLKGQRKLAACLKLGPTV
ncbi:hypothetical protein L1887_54416 [Cichorium endivia]|nr:hypothetical protein L1887_54416 [Cichorium endivia]